MVTRAKGRGLVVTVALAALAAPCRAEDPALACGLAVYRDRCTVCHGPEGRGDVEATYPMLRPPRDFHAARFRFVSTWERVPTDDDLYGVITRGLPGSQMPSFAHLPDADRRRRRGSTGASSSGYRRRRCRRTTGRTGTTGGTSSDSRGCCRERRGPSAP